MEKGNFIKRTEKEMKSGIVYLKTDQNVQVVNKKILLQDAAEIYSADSNMVKEIGNTVLYTVKGNKDEILTFSVIKVIGIIQKAYPDVTVQHIGEPEFIVEYKMPVPDKRWLEYIKLIFVAFIVFFGSAFTIMTFNTDVSVGDVFNDLYYLVTGVHKSDGSILEIAYSIGIPVGILGFYNHFKSQKVHDDPTPIHMEMRTFEEDLNKTIITDSSREGRMIK